MRSHTFLARVLDVQFGATCLSCAHMAVSASVYRVKEKLDLRLRVEKLAVRFGSALHCQVLWDCIAMF